MVVSNLPDWVGLRSWYINTKKLISVLSSNSMKRDNAVTDILSKRHWLYSNETEGCNETIGESLSLNYTKSP